MVGDTAQAEIIYIPGDNLFSKFSIITKPTHHWEENGFEVGFSEEK